MKRRTVWALAVTALVLVTGTAQASWFDDVRIYGYTQVDFHVSQDDDRDIDIRRARIAAKGAINDEGTKFKVQFDLSKLDGSGGTLVLKDAYVQHPFTDMLDARVGFGAHPLGHEVEYSSSKRPFMERSYASGKFAPGEQDLGVYLFGETGGSSVEYILGYSNGMDKWYKKGATDGASYLARVDMPFGDNGSFAGVTYRIAHQTASPALAEDCLNVHVIYNHEAGCSFWGEYYNGEVKGVDSDGFYGAVIYDLPSDPFRVYYRYDQFGQTAADDYQRHIVGANYDLTRNQTLTLEVGSWDHGLSQDTTIDGRWQFKY